MFVGLSLRRSYRNLTNLKYHWDQTGPEDDSNKRQCIIRYSGALLGNRTLPEDVPLDSVSENFGNCGPLHERSAHVRITQFSQHSAWRLLRM
jgi:hypothetical protein